MAIAATCVHEVRTTGNDLNGGAFRAGAAGTDYSQQDSAAKSGNDLTMHATDNTKVNPVAAGVAAADVGNTCFIPPAIPGWTTGLYEITAQDGTYWTLDRSPAAAAEATLSDYKMGGALASPGAFGRNHVAGNDCHVKSGTYTVTSATPNVAAGCLTAAGGGGAATDQKIEGYGSSRGDKGTFPIYKSDGTITTFTLITLAGASILENIEVDGNSRTSSRGVSIASTSALARRVRVKNCTNNAFNSGNADLCEATGCSTAVAFNSVSLIHYCVAWSNTFHGFTPGSCAHGCYAVNNSGATTDGFNIANGVPIITNCVSYNSGRDGFRMTIGAQVGRITNSIAEANAGTGFNGTSNPGRLHLLNCAYYNNGTNVVASVGSNVGGILGTASFFTNAAGNDFSLNNTAGAGAALRAAGIPGVTGGTYGLPGISTSSYPDVGGAQHADPASGVVVRRRAQYAITRVSRYRRPSILPASVAVIVARRRKVM